MLSRQAAQGDSAAASRRAFFGTIALSIVNSGRLALQVLVLPIMARILGPAAFGLVSLAMPFILFANMLSDAGMGNALIRHQDPDHEVESTVFWISLGVGLSIAVAVCALSGVIAGVVHQPHLAPIVIGLSPILVLSSMLSVANARISRARHFGMFAIGDLISTVLSSGAGILAALSGWGAWSLVLQQVVLWSAKAAWILPISSFRPSLRCRPALARGLLAFGLHNVGADIAGFLGKSAPALVIGSTLGVVAVGHYSMAYQLVRIPELVLSGPLALAIFTAISALAASASGAAALSMRTIRMVVCVLAPLFCGLALVSDLVIEVFLGPKWQGTADELAILSAAGFFLGVCSLFGAVLMGLGRADLQFRLSLLCGGAMVLGAVVGQHFGLEAAVVGVTLAAAAAFPAYLTSLARQLDIPLKAMLGEIARPLAATAIMALAVLGLRLGLRTLPPGAELAAAVALGVAVFAAALWAIAGRRLLTDLKTILPPPPPPEPDAGDRPDAPACEPFEPEDFGVTVLIAAKDAEASVGRAVASALAEPLAREVIVVDDSSTDATAARAVQADDGTGRLRVIRLERNLGPAGARNVALAFATQPWVAILDSDDYWLPGRLGAMARFVDGYDIVADDLSILIEEDMGARPVPLIGGADLPFDVSLEDFLLHNISQKGCYRREWGFLKPLIRRTFLVRYGLCYDGRVRLGEDLILYAQALALGARFRIVPACGYVAVERRDSLSATHTGAHLDALLVAARKLRETNARPEVRQALRRYLRHLKGKTRYRQMLEARKAGGVLGLIRQAVSSPDALPSAVLGRLERVEPPRWPRAEGAAAPQEHAHRPAAERGKAQITRTELA